MMSIYRQNLCLHYMNCKTSITVPLLYCTMLYILVLSLLFSKLFYNNNDNFCKTETCILKAFLNHLLFSLTCANKQAHLFQKHEYMFMSIFRCNIAIWTVWLPAWTWEYEARYLYKRAVEPTWTNLQWHAHNTVFIHSADDTSCC